jgi:hypothetical protein
LFLRLVVEEEEVLMLRKMQHLVDLVVDKEQQVFQEERYFQEHLEMLVDLVHQKAIPVEDHTHMRAVMHLPVVVVVLVLLEVMDHFLVLPHQDQLVLVE